MPGKRRRVSINSKKKKKTTTTTSTTAAQQESQGWFSIRRIADEKIVKNCIHYLVEWEEKKDSGEDYPPSWIKSKDVTLAAITEWKAQKTREERQVHTGPRQDPQPQAASAEDSDDSQPPRSAQRRRPPRSNALELTRRQRVASLSSGSSASEPPHEIQRADRAKSHSEEPGLDLTSTSSSASASEVHDLSYQEIVEFRGLAVVEIIQKRDFDPSDYLSVTNSQASTQSLAELETQDSQIALVPFSQGTIPDSQDISDELPSSYARIPETPASRVIPNSSKTDDSLPFSGAEATDIPSHQPDHLGDTVDAQGAEFSEVTPPAALVADPDPALRTSGSPERAVEESTQPTTSSKYLSQPIISLSFPIPTSSIISDHGAAFTNSPICEVTSLKGQESQPASVPGESQNAQIVPQIFHSIQEPLTDSQSVSAGIIDQQTPKSIRSQLASDCDRKESGVAVVESSLPSVFHHQFSPIKSQIMDSSGEERASSGHRMSAADELSILLGLVPESEPVAESSHEKPDLEPTAESTSESAPQFQSQAEIPIHASLGLDTQSVDAGTTSWNEAAAGSNPEFAVDSVAPLDVLSQPPHSATEALLNIVDISFAASSSRVSDLQPPHHTPETQHATVSPADITRQDEPDQTDVPPMPSSLLLEEAVPPKMFEIPGGVSPQADQTPSNQVSSEASSPHQGLVQDFIVTLPFQASLRPFYDQILMEYKRPITEFSHAFSGEIYVEPPESLVSKIDELCGRLYNLCDYPRDVLGSALEELPPKDIAKYCCDANSKFSFVFELLQNLQKNTKVLIIARSPELLRLLHHITDALQLECKCDAIGKPKSEFEHSTVQVVLTTANETIDPSVFDVVIGFDSSFQASQYMLQSPSREGSSKQQLILALVITHSIEHIALQISESPEVLELNELEQKDILMAAIVRIRKLLLDPERNYLEPHQIAALFCKFLNGEENDIPWESLAVPDEVLDNFYPSQIRSQMPIPQELENGRKRKFDSADDADVKRMKMLSAQELEYDAKANQPPLPDDVHELLETATLKQKSTKPEVIVRVSLSLLEVFAQQASEYERRIKDVSIDAEYKAIITNLETRNKEYERTTEKIYSSHRAALEDRSKFETEMQKAEAARKAAVEAAEKEAGKSQKKIEDLEQTIARLTQDPDSANPEDAPLAKNEKLLQEALAKIALLEKRLENSNQDGSYIRNAYQEATSAATAMKRELVLLQEQNQELSRKASDNAVQIQQIQAQNTVAIYARQIGELKAQVKEREAELDRTRDELRQLKNGRRETRGVSVPHSPRMGIMSPRMGRAYGPGSRGNSPAPVAAAEGSSTQQPGNSRWNHLRE